MHPMIFSTREFTEDTGLVLGIPMTSSKSNLSNRYAIPFVEQSELKFVLPSMPKSFVLQARSAAPHPWGKVPGESFGGRERCWSGCQLVSSKRARGYASAPPAHKAHRSRAPTAIPL